MKSSVEMVVGAQERLMTISAYVDGCNDPAQELKQMVDSLEEGDELVILTDVLGGSVNNEFTKIVQTRPNTYLIANMNLPLLIQLLFSDQEAPADQVIREILAADDTRVKFVNDLLTDADDEEEF